jgi:two-component system, NarL family, response regulator NreC
MGARLRVVRTPSEGGPGGREPSSIRVVLADGHTRSRQSLQLVLEHEDDIDVIAETGDLTSTMHKVVSRQPDVLVLDVNMSEGSGWQIIGELREQAPDTQIVIASMNDGPSFARTALARGALGYVLKEQADSELGDAVRAAARKERYVSARVGAGRQRRDAARRRRALE